MITISETVQLVAAAGGAVVADGLEVATVPDRSGDLRPVTDTRIVPALFASPLDAERFCNSLAGKALATWRGREASIAAWVD
jgi:hypothetical protein